MCVLMIFWFELTAILIVGGDSEAIAEENHDCRNLECFISKCRRWRREAVELCYENVDGRCLIAGEVHCSAARTDS